MPNHLSFGRSWIFDKKPFLFLINTAFTMYWPKRSSDMKMELIGPCTMLLERGNSRWWTTVLPFCHRGFGKVPAWRYLYSVCEAKPVLVSVSLLISSYWPIGATWRG